MGNVGLFETKTHGTNESLEFWWFTGEVLAHECDFVDSSLPAFSLSLTWPDNFEHFGFCHGLYFLNWYGPFTCLFFTFLLDHVCKNFGVFLLFSVHEICRYGSFFNVLNSAFGIFLFVFLDGFFHLNLLFESFLVEYFGLESSEGLCFFGDDFSLSGVFLSAFLFSVESLTETFSMEVDIVVLRHGLWVMLKRKLL